MNRPSTLHVGGTAYWVLRLFDANGELVDADSTPTVSVRKNGSAVGDSVTVTKRSATTGIYDCSYNPAAETEGDTFTLEEAATIGGTNYENSWELIVVAPLSDIKGGGWDSGTDTLEDIRDAIDAIDTGSGSGARTIAVTVDDGSNPVEGARVRYTNGAFSYVATTDANGECTLNLDDATYVVAISRIGYSFAGTTHVVSGDATPTYSVTAIVVTPPPSAETSTGVLTVYSNEGVAEQGVDVSVQITSGPGTAGYGYDTEHWTETSDANGLVEFVGLIRGATYSIWRGSYVGGDNDASTFVVPDSDSFNIAEVLGKEE